jgi:sulfur-oxidizing protein SoxY
MNEFPDGPDSARRAILMTAIAGGLAGLGFAGSAVLSPVYAAADAKEWPQNAFKEKNQAAVLKDLYGKSEAVASDKINLDAPEIAENGAVVPIAVTSKLPKVTGIAILVLENPNILAAAYKIPEGTEAAASSRLKMAKTSKVVAIVESGGKLYSATQEVKVTVGGCGG